VALSGGFVERDIASVRLPLWGRVVAVEGVVPWLVVDPDGSPVEPVQRFLRDFVARGNRADSVRSYAYGLLRWWRWLLCTCQVDLGSIRKRRGLMRRRAVISRHPLLP
jgi:hypothetical protein